MGSVAFDTLKLAQKLEAAGFPRAQATGAAEAIAETVGEAVVTRDHLDLRLAAQTAELKAWLEVRLADVRLDLVKWMVGLFLGQTAMLTAVVKLL
jgi:hypothetical protein